MDTKWYVAGNARFFEQTIPNSTSIVVAAIFDFITEEEWGERGRLRVGGEEGGRNNQQSATNCIDIVLKWVTSENGKIHTHHPHPSTES